MAGPSVVIPFSFTADCLLPCCLPANCRCGSNFAHDLGCPLPAPPAVYGRDMPAVLYGQVTGYRTLKTYFTQQVGDPPGGCSNPHQVGGCFEYLGQLTNWPFRLITTVGGAIPVVGYYADKAYFRCLDQRLGPADCTLAGFLPYTDTTSPPPGGFGASCYFACGAEMRCTFASPAAFFASCGEASPFSIPNCVAGSAFGRFEPAVVDTVGALPPGSVRETWVRTGVLSCDPFWGRIEFYDAYGLSADHYLPGGEPTCDQTGHPEPPCCANIHTGLKGPCGLLSRPPDVLAYRSLGGTCNDATDNPANREIAPLAVRIDLFETPV